MQILVSCLMTLLSLDSCHGFSVSATSKQQQQPSHGLSENLQQQIQNAIQLSSIGKTNITAAHDACQTWQSILFGTNNDDDVGNIEVLHQPRMENGILVLCQALYASCLVRIGRDDKAVFVYDLALQNIHMQKHIHMNDENNDLLLLLGKAQAHQRLLQYEHAKDTFHMLCRLDPYKHSYMMGAATCCLRLNQPKEACAIVEAYCNCNKAIVVQEVQQEEEEASIDPSDLDAANANAFLGVLKYAFLEQEDTMQIIPLLQAAAGASPLYQWIYGTLSTTDDMVIAQNMMDSNCDSLFLMLLQINLFPLDDPALMWLDDKVHLHKLLVESEETTQTFWPTGMVLPEETIRLQAALIKEEEIMETPQLWIAKKRAGYGSHGNQIVTLQQSLDRLASDSETGQEEELLLQQLIDPTLLISGRRLSLRIYVIYFSPKDVYLSSQGLVKIAATSCTSSATNGDVIEDRAYMTNSGREETMMQQDLNYLQEDSGLFVDSDEYDTFWSKICESVRSVMASYHRFQQQQQQQEKIYSLSLSSAWNERRESLSIPKIMGLDYVVDQTYNPWLLEVNRFPGLEPRDESDRHVKHQVVRDAWICANHRRQEKNPAQTEETHPLHYILDQLPSVTDECPFSLEKL
jgi:tetratricopeptide (TPR) repeat protein